MSVALGSASAPSFNTSAIAGNSSDVGTGSVFFNVIVTVSPSWTQSIGPGYWNAPLPAL